MQKFVNRIKKPLAILLAFIFLMTSVLYILPAFVK